MSLGTNIQQLRKTALLSQEQLADSLNVSRQAVSKWETDQTLPEIDKLLAMSQLFNVSTDSMLNNDVESVGFQGSEKEKNGIVKISNITVSAIKRFPYRDNKVLFYLFSIICIIAIGVCIFVNLALNNLISWAMYPIVSVSFVWIVSIPVFFHKYIFSLCTATVLVFPLLYFIDSITPVRSWFIPLGVPSAIIGLTIVWLSYLLFRFVKIDLYYRLAISPCTTGIIATLLINGYVDKFTNTTSSYLNTVINVFSYSLTTISFCLIG
jgi:transcriptional regulator with XRE-family HTH domain